MPNHIHGIIIITKSVVGAIHESPLHEMPLRDKRRQMMLSKIIGQFKMNSAKQINLSKNISGTPVWQRNYYERIIRDDDELNRVRGYIKNNPVNWKQDRNYIL